MLTLSMVINNNKQVVHRKAVRIHPLGCIQKGTICTYELFEGRKKLGTIFAEYGDAKWLGIAMLEFDKGEKDDNKKGEKLS